jgi:thioredoxin 1
MLEMQVRAVVATAQVVAVDSINRNKKRNLALKIIIPFVVVAIIAGIWFFKANQEEQEKVNSDFLLAASEIDLDKLKSYDLPILIDFGADSCIPCREMAPVLKKMNQEWQGKVIVKFVDVWKYPNASADFPVQMIPTQFFFYADGSPYIPSDPEGMQMIMYSLKDSGEHVYTAHVGGMTEEQIRAVFAEMGIK